MLPIIVNMDAGVVDMSPCGSLINMGMMGVCACPMAFIAVPVRSPEFFVVAVPVAVPVVVVPVGMAVPVLVGMVVVVAAGNIATGQLDLFAIVACAAAKFA